MKIRRATTGALLGVCASLSALSLLLSAPPPAQAATHLQSVGDGSSWAANAVNQWVTDVTQQGLQVVFTSTGSAQGRQDFANQTVDFAVSDIGYQGQDPLTGNSDQSQRPYAYLPIVSGGTSFPYQIMQNGQLVRNLRLKPLTLAKIFTNQITMWNDPAVTADNNGRVLPAIPIIPVVHSEGSGSTAQFTTFLDTEFPNVWRPFIGKGGDTAPAGKDFTEYFPYDKAPARAQNGSDQVINFIGAAGSDGAIGFDEYSYAIQKNLPVVKVENNAGYYTLPTQYNVAVALTQAKIDPTTLLQTLNDVYIYNDPRTYPLSSYSYAIIPTSATDKINTGKRQTMVDFLSYSICGGQREMGPIGYSSLPLNLVQASFAQIALLHTADPGVDLTNTDPTKCNNPTFDPSNPSQNRLAEIAPQPPACDHDGQGPSDASGNCGGGGGGGNHQSGGATGGATGSTGDGSSGNGPGGGPTSGPGGVTSSVGGPTTKARAATGGAATGQSALGSTAGLQDTTGVSGGGPTSEDTAASPGPTSLADGPALSVGGFRWVGAWLLMVPLCLVLVILALIGPALLTWVLERAKAGSDG